MMERDERPPPFLVGEGGGMARKSGARREDGGVASIRGVRGEPLIPALRATFSYRKGRARGSSACSRVSYHTPTTFTPSW